MNGEYRNALDDKGRLLIPSRMRSAVPGNVLRITRGIDRCLWVFPLEEWKRVSDKLMNSSSLFQSKSRLLRRRIVAPAQDVEIDKTGRITIPPTLRASAGLKKDTIILGIERYIEIWDEEAYGAYLNANEDTFQEASEELGEILSV